MENIDNSIKGIVFKGFEGYNMSSFSFFLSENNRLNKMTFGRPFLLYFLRCFYDTYGWKYSHGNTPILFFTQRTRDQHLKMFTSLSNLVEDSKTLFFNKKITFSLKEGIYIMKLLFSWLNELKKTNLTNEQKKRLVNELVRCKKLDLFVDKYTNEIGVPNLLVLFYDAHGDANFLIQKFKKKGSKTATLSHGLVLAERDKNLIDYSAIELRGTTSDYFLAWNNFTLTEAKKQGYNIDKMKVLGIPHFLDSKFRKIERVKNRIFGLVLDNHSGDKFNRELITYADSLSKEIDYKFIVRYHPNFKGNEYDSLIINKENYLGKDLSFNVVDYSKSVEFSLLINSSVFIELIYLNHLVYRFRLNDLHDKYRDVKLNSFKDKDELIYLIKNNVDESDALFEDLCSVSNVKKSYSDFFLNFN